MSTQPVHLTYSLLASLSLPAAEGCIFVCVCLTGCLNSAQARTGLRISLLLLAAKKCIFVCVCLPACTQLKPRCLLACAHVCVCVYAYLIIGSARAHVCMCVCVCVPLPDSTLRSHRSSCPVPAPCLRRTPPDSCSHLPCKYLSHSTHSVITHTPRSHNPQPRWLRL